MTVSEFKDSLENKNVYVVGLSGQEGYAIGEFLQSLGINFTACDFAENRVQKIGTPFCLDNFCKIRYHYNGISCC